jgi:hypothetical protein
MEPQAILMIQPGSLEDLHLILPPVGFIAQHPDMWAGILKLPPISPPIPRIDPPPEINAASPPEDPPGILVGS